MYSMRSIVHGFRNPELIGRELNRLIYTRGKRHNFNPSGTYIFNEEWDNLLILDACRYDYYVDMADFNGTIEARQSLGGATYEFIPANFSDRQLHDVVIVTTNPQYIKFQDLIDVHDLIYIPELDLQKDDITEKGVVSPEAVTRIAKEADEKYPNKRLVVHYLQPHRPYIGPTGLQRFQPNTSWRDISDEIIKRAYRENMEIVLSTLDDLLPQLTGKSIVTSDHGEMLGERYRYIPMKDYGHWNGIYDHQLVTVPWHIIESDKRKKIVAEPPEQEDTNRGVTERLELLGYAQS